MALTDNLIYFDNNATTRMDDAVLDAMLPFMREYYGNAASRLHAFGWVAEAAIEKASQQVAELLHCSAEELVFTSGATESMNLAIKGLFEAAHPSKRHIITCATEHRAVLDTCAYLERHRGARVSLLGVDREGIIDLDALQHEVADDTLMVCIMAVNNETGVKQPLEGIAELCRRNKLLFVCDGTQMAGRERCDVAELGADAFALSAHKFYGPKGVGALYLKRQRPELRPIQQISGGNHQHGLRSGTLHVAGIVGLGKTAELAATHYWDRSAHISRLRNRFEHQLLDMEGLRINGSTRHRSYTTSNLTFPPGKAVSSLLHKFAFSSGSACSSADPEPSHVLSAMGVNREEAQRSFRFSFSQYNTEAEVDTLVHALKAL